MIKLNNAQSANADLGSLLDPFVNSWISPFADKSYHSNNAYQQSMHACKPIGNNQLQSNMNPLVAFTRIDSPSSDFPSSDHSGYNSSGSLHDESNAMGGVTLPFIPDELLYSLSSVMFEPKQSAVQKDDGLLKKINSHSKRNHKVLFYSLMYSV